MTNASDFFAKGWCRFAHDPELAAWIETTLPAARATVSDPANANWLRYQGTWFAGVNVLPNDETGAVPGGWPLSGNAVDFIHSVLEIAEIAWDKAQVSICYPGYPKPMDGETEGQHRFRRDRDAAHVDGLLGLGSPKRRFLKEPHQFILGLPMVEASPGASPFVIWEGSHEIMREAFTRAFAGHTPASWPDIDITDIYVSARKHCFDTCRRLEIHALPGEACIVHRLALHGVAPWAADAMAGPDGRMICYFRPAMDDLGEWLKQP
jgi:hypothetical protein